MRQSKKYARVRDPETGTLHLVHRRVAAEMLGRPLLPGEIVHHRNGDSANNAPDNLVVLPSQRLHAHIEHHLRRQKQGMSPLFPALLGGLNENRQGTLFEGVF